MPYRALAACALSFTESAIFVRSTSGRWAAAIRDAGVKLDQ